MLFALLALGLSPAPLQPRQTTRARPSFSLPARPSFSLPAGLALPARPAVALAAALAAVPLPSFADPTLDALLQNEDVKQLGVFFVQTVISWGVPGAVVLFIVSIAAGGKGGEEEDDLPPALARVLGMSKEPREYLKVERLNNKLESFDYSLGKATVSKESALRASREQQFRRVWGAELASLELTGKQLDVIEKGTERYRKAQAKLQRQLETNTRKLRAATLTARYDRLAFDAIMAEEGGEIDAEKGAGPLGTVLAMVSSASGASADSASAEGADEKDKKAGAPPGMLVQFKSAMALSKLTEEVSSLQEKLQALDLQFLSGLAAAVSPEQALALAAALRAKDGAGGVVDVLQAMPRLRHGGAPASLAEAAKEQAAALGRPARLYTLSFFGDVTASQVSSLRQEVTAVLRNADAAHGDEVMLVLNTGGGTVTGYGLAAAQLGRVRGAGLPLTVAVEQVAASGGYMMACVADRIVASPFAVLGSIGVITEQPNVYERLKREGIEFNTITAGKFKRTLTPTKKVEPADVKKQKDDIEQVLQLFKGFVQTNRPGLDIDAVATGETWFGPDALTRGLVDELATSDELLTRAVAAGKDVFSIKYSAKPPGILASLGADAGAGWRPALLGLATRALLGGGAADLGTRGLRAAEPEVRWEEAAQPVARVEGFGRAAEQPSWGWDDF